MEIRKNFLRGVMNKDLDDRLMPDSVYRDALNVKAASSDDQDSGTVQNYLGNTQMFDVTTLIQAEGLPATSNIVPIGSFTDTKNNYIYWFLTSSLYDIIFRYFESDAGVGSGRLVLVESRSTGIMKFNQNYLITGINIVEDLLFFTDGLNPPRRINVSKDYRNSSISEDNVNVIVKPPLLAPGIVLVDDPSIEENTIEDKFIRFAYRYRYVNNEFSSLSPFSKTAFEAQEFKFDFNTGRNESMRNKANSIEITIDLGSQEVDKVEIVAKDSRNNNTLIITSIDKSTLLSAQTTYKYTFRNNKVYAVLPNTQVTRLFDNVPLSARAQDLIGSRIVYGNYKQFFDLKRPSGETIVPNFTLSVQSTAIEEGMPAETFKSGRDYEVGIAYLDQFGRMTTVMESTNATLSLPITKAVTKNDLKVSISSRAPVFASKYRLFLKQNRGTYYNMLPIAVYQDGLFVYFQLAKYDIDKTKAGDYIYIKSTPSGISTTTEKYKVLEAEQKVKNFLGEQKEQGQEEGFYVKLKVDNNLFDENSFVTYKDRGQGYNGYGGVERKKNNWNIRPLNFIGNYVDLPIFYGKGSSDLYVITKSKDYQFDTDRRFVVEVTGPRTFSYRDYRLSSNYATNVAMNSETVPTPSGNTLGNALRVNIGGVSYVFGYIIFGVTGLSNYRIGDSWRVNYRGSKYSINGSPVNFENEYGHDGPYAAIPFRGSSVLDNDGDLPITPGSIIKFQINEGYDQPEQRFVSSGSYDNIEEWFFEEKIYEKFVQQMTDGKPDGAKTVFFRRGVLSGQNVEYPELIDTSDPRGYIVMFIKGYSSSEKSRTSTNTARKAIYLNFSVLSPANLTILETEGINNNDAIYYELPGTYPIENGFHRRLLDSDTNQTLAETAVITLADFNAITFGNGMESSIIEDDWNGPELLPSPRASAAIDRYEQVVVDNGLTYSQVFNESTSTNNLNEFNLSLANFKILEKEYGPIQKLYSRDGNLLVFQEDKVSTVLFGKNLLSDSTGGGSVVSVPEVLGTQMAMNAEYGISNNPESFAKWGTDIFFTDQKRGAVLNIQQNSLEVVSTYGLKNWFRELFDDSPGTQKIGAYDPYEFKYVLAANDIKVFPCELELSSDDIFISGNAVTGAFLFNITTNSSWSITVANGSWLTLNATSGNGSRAITANITSNLANTVNRVATITITYCDGLTRVVTVTQSYETKKQVVVVTVGDKTNDGAKSVRPVYDFGGGSFTGARIPIDLAGDYSFVDISPDFVGQGFTPDVSDTVEIIGTTGFQDASGNLTKPFNPNLGDKMYYLDTDELYDPSQGDELISDATLLTIGGTGGFNTLVTNTGDKIVTNTGDGIALLLNYTGSFTYSGTGNYLYLITDYRNNINMGTTITAIPAPLVAAPESIRLNNTGQIGKYSVTYSSNSTDIRFVVENANGAVISDSGYVSTPSSRVFNISKTLSGQDVIKVYNEDYTDNPTYTITVGSIALTSASISSVGFNSVSGACASTTTQTIYHNSNSALPIAGSTIYTSSGGSTLFIGDNKYYKAGTNALQINNLGVVISSTSCICGEAAAPTVIQSSINIVQNQAVSLTIQATNNPISFAAAGTCREFSLFGGSGGAVFSGQDCKTGLTKQVFVSTNETITMCFFLNSVFKFAGAANATFTDVGGCVDTALPEGVTFETLTGTLSGTPTQSGNFKFTVTATNCVGVSSPVTFEITVQPDVQPNNAFFIDTASPQSTSGAACSLSPSFSTLYHDGILSYPVIRDIIFQDQSGLNRLAGGNLWRRMDNGVVIRVDSEGIVQDTFLCGIVNPTPPAATGVLLSPGISAAAACASSAFVLYYKTGSIGINPGKLYTNVGATIIAPAAFYKYEVEPDVFVSFQWTGIQWTVGVDCL